MRLNEWNSRRALCTVAESDPRRVMANDPRPVWDGSPPGVYKDEGQRGHNTNTSMSLCLSHRGSPREHFLPRPDHIPLSHGPEKSTHRIYIFAFDCRVHICTTVNTFTAVLMWRRGISKVATDTMGRRFNPRPQTEGREGRGPCCPCAVWVGACWWCRVRFRARLAKTWLNVMGRCQDRSLNMCSVLISRLCWHGVYRSNDRVSLRCGVLDMQTHVVCGRPRQTDVFGRHWVRALAECSLSNSSHQLNRFCLE